MKKSRILFLKNIDREEPGHLLDIVTELGYGSDVLLLNEELFFSDFHDSYDFLVVLGGITSANDKTFVMQRQIEFVKKWLESGKPFLGICLGMQIMVKALNGQVLKQQVKEVGFHYLGDPNKKYTINILNHKDNPLRGILDDELLPFLLHNKRVVLEKNKMDSLASSNLCENQVVRYNDKQIGLQFHLEMTEKVMRNCLKYDDDLLFINQELCLSTFKIQEKKLLQNCKSLMNYLLEGLD